MTLTIIVATGVLIAAGVAISRRHYIFAVAIGILAGYELMVPILASVLEDAKDLRYLALFTEDMSERSSDGFLAGLALFFALFVVSYLLGGRRTTGLPVSARAPSFKLSSGLAIFPIVVLVFGLVSVVTGAGQARLQDYVGIGDTLESSRFFAYGGLMLITCVGIVLNRLSAGKAVAALAVVACLAPLLMELFIAGRRQWFAPSALLVLMFLLYSRVRFKVLFAAGFTCIVAVLFAVQFGLREQARLASTGFETEPLVLAVLAPQLGEFAGISYTSHNAWTLFVTGQTPVTYGVHWAFHALNTIPFLKLADTWFPHYSADLLGMYDEVTPWGGLSMLADALMAMGLPGVLVVAAAIGILCRRAHEFTASAMRAGMPGDAYSLFGLAIIATLLLKYRSGVGDAIQAVVSFSILYWAIFLLGYLLLDRKAGALAGLRHAEGPEIENRGVT